MRMRKKKHGAERIAACSELLIENIEVLKDGFGDVFAEERPVHMEIGCGKGNFACGMAAKYPDINFVMVHLDLGSDHQEALEVLGMADNLYGDTTWVPLETTLEVIKRYGSKKIMFGSDAPIDGVDTYHTNKFGEDSLYLDYWYKLPNLISKEDYENIMYKNAINVFNLGGIIYE